MTKLGRFFIFLFFFDLRQLQFEKSDLLQHRHNTFEVPSGKSIFATLEWFRRILSRYNVSIKKPKIRNKQHYNDNF